MPGFHVKDINLVIASNQHGVASSEKQLCLRITRKNPKVIQIIT